MRMTKKVMNATKTKRFVDLTLRPVGTTVVGVRIEAVQVRILSCKKNKKVGLKYQPFCAHIGTQISRTWSKMKADIFIDVYKP